MAYAVPFLSLACLDGLAQNLLRQPKLFLQYSATLKMEWDRGVGGFASLLSVKIVSSASGDWRSIV